MTEEELNVAIKERLTKHREQMDALRLRSIQISENLCLVHNVMIYKIGAARVEDRSKSTLKEILDSESEVFAGILSKGVSNNG